MNTLTIEASPLHLGKLSVPVKHDILEVTSLPLDANNNPQNQTDQLLQIVHNDSAAITAVIRKGVSISLPRNIGQIILAPGDSILLNEARPNEFTVIPLW